MLVVDVVRLSRAQRRSFKPVSLELQGQMSQSTEHNYTQSIREYLLPLYPHTAGKPTSLYLPIRQYSQLCLNKPSSD